MSIRAVDAGDRDGLVAFVAQLSDESRRRLFMGAKKELSARERAELTRVDHVSHETLVAIDDTLAIVGLARYAAREDGSADFAVSVADAWQRRGVGRFLAEELIRRACENRIRHLHATTLCDNHPARALLNRLGFRVFGANGGALELVTHLGCGHRRLAGLVPYS